MQRFLKALNFNDWGNKMDIKKGFNFAEGANWQRLVAFTLAEVLITLGIIGVVAAMTLPSLINDHRDKETVAKLKKDYSIINQAYLMAKNEFGTFDEWGITTDMSNPQSHIIFANNMKKYLKVSQDCVGMSKDDVIKNCIRDEERTKPTYYAVIRLADGTAVIFRTYNGKCTHNYNASGNSSLSNVCGDISFYIRPNKKYPIPGKNIFSFYMTKDGVIPMGVADGAFQFEKACNKSIKHPYTDYTGEQMFACTAWVIYNENMDYWKCDDLSWNGKKKCSDK